MYIIIFKREEKFYLVYVGLVTVGALTAETLTINSRKCGQGCGTFATFFLLREIDDKQVLIELHAHTHPNEICWHRTFFAQDVSVVHAHAHHDEVQRNVPSCLQRGCRFF